jgi:PD-(D/E)XK endonuclease
MDEKNNNSGEEQEKEVIDLQAVADNNPKRVGEVIEAAFLAKVCKLRIPICKPWGDSERYDFVVDWGKGFWSVQVKGGTSQRGSFYKVVSGARARYSRRTTWISWLCILSRKICGTWCPSRLRRDRVRCGSIRGRRGLGLKNTGRPGVCWIVG